MTGIIGPLVSLLLVRYLGVELYGLYASATAVTSLLAILTDFGLQQAALEAVESKKYPLGAVLQSIVKLGGLYTLIAYSAVTLWMWFGSYQQTVVVLTLLTALGYFQTPLLSAATVGLQTKGLYGRIALWNWASSTAQWGGTLIAIAARMDIYSVVLWPLLFRWMVTVGMLVREGRTLEVGPLLGLTRRSSIPLTAMFNRSWRFGTAGTMYQVYHRSDSALLSLMRDPVEIGNYAVAFRVIELLSVFPGIVFNQVLYPKYFRWFKENKERVEQYYQMTSKWMLALGVSTATMVTMFARDAVVLVFGLEQQPAAVFLTIMAWAVPARFVASSAGALLTTGDQIERKVRIQAAVAVMNVSMNVVLIPIYGALASSGLLVFTDLLLLLLYSTATWRHQGLRLWDSYRQAALAAIVMAACLGLVLAVPSGLLPRLARGCLTFATCLVYIYLATTRRERVELRRLLGGTVGVK